MTRKLPRPIPDSSLRGQAGSADRGPMEGNRAQNPTDSVTHSSKNPTDSLEAANDRHRRRLRSQRERSQRERLGCVPLLTHRSVYRVWVRLQPSRQQPRAGDADSCGDECLPSTREEPKVSPLWLHATSRYGCCTLAVEPQRFLHSRRCTPDRRSCISYARLL